MTWLDFGGHRSHQAVKVAEASTSTLGHQSPSRRVMHDGMHYDLIQGQGHEPFKVGNLAIFKTYFICHLQ